MNSCHFLQTGARSFECRFGRNRVLLPLLESSQWDVELLRDLASLLPRFHHGQGQDLGGAAALGTVSLLPDNLLDAFSDTYHGKLATETCLR